MSWSPIGSQVIEITHCVASFEIEKKFLDVFLSPSKPKMTILIFLSQNCPDIESQTKKPIIHGIQICFRSIGTRILSFILFNLPKVCIPTYGVKNFSKGVKNFWNRPSSFPKSIQSWISIRFRYWNVRHYMEVTIGWNEVYSLVFYPTSKVFYPIYTFCKIFFNITHTHTGMHFVKGRFDKYLEREFFIKIEETFWTSHHQGYSSQENTFCNFPS